ncbi:MAG TPA: response regulator, partial [Terriglobales bacterium]|nr:response regulator [Terriglobales bacterium]
MTSVTLRPGMTEGFGCLDNPIRAPATTLLMDVSLESIALIQKMLCSPNALQPQSKKHEVFSAADGEKALEFFETHDVDLVLLDYKMPGMDGGTVAREMKRRASTVPIIMISGN